jgi:hypothetical protein
MTSLLQGEGAGVAHRIDEHCDEYNDKRPELKVDSKNVSAETFYDDEIFNEYTASFDPG